MEEHKKDCASLVQKTRRFLFCLFENDHQGMWSTWYTKYLFISNSYCYWSFHHHLKLLSKPPLISNINIQKKIFSLFLDFSICFEQSNPQLLLLLLLPFGHFEENLVIINWKLRFVFSLIRHFLLKNQIHSSFPFFPSPLVISREISCY